MNDRTNKGGQMLTLENLGKGCICSLYYFCEFSVILKIFQNERLKKNKQRGACAALLPKLTFKEQKWRPICDMYYISFI